MTLIDLGPGSGAQEPVGVADAKAWCRIERNDEDGLIAGLIKAARETVEAETRLVLVRRAFRIVVDPVPGDGWIEVERHPVQAVTSVLALDGFGVPTEFGPGEAVVERALGVEAVRVSRRVVEAAANGVEVELVAGFLPGEAPETLKLAIRRIVSASYELRAAVPIGMQPGIVPPAARALIAPYRRVRL